MLVSFVFQCWVFCPFYRVSWPRGIVRTCPIALCHVSWYLATFALNSGTTFWTSEYFWVHQMNFKMFLSSYIWRSDEFLGSSYELCSSYELQWVPRSMSLQTCPWTCAWERKVKLSLHANTLGDLLVFI